MAENEKVDQSISPCENSRNSNNHEFPESKEATDDEATGDGELGDQGGERTEPPYSIFTHREKATMILLVSFTAIISPLSGAVYLPALPSLARDLNVSTSLINLTVTTYLVRLRLAVH